MLYSINYNYCKVLKKIQIGFNEADPTLEFNRSTLIVIAALLFKSPRRHSNSWLTSSDNSQEGRYPTGRSYKCQHDAVNVAFAVHVDNSYEGKQLIRHEV